jgi:FPC/CPF motif-containing protein YcgG
MSQKLPETADEMLQISHVTKANFEKYGEGLLKICQQHAAAKKGEIMFIFLLQYFLPDWPIPQINQPL